jgi:hypothetical protein
VAVRLQRLLAPATRLEPGQWSAETASGREAVCCPGCGEIAERSDTHRVLTGGLVSPIWNCPSCSFLDFLELEAHGEPWV